MKRKQIRLQRWLVREGKLREAMELYPGKTREEVRELLFFELKKRLLPGCVVAVGFVVLAVLMPKGEKTNDLIRPEPGAAAMGVQVLLELESGWKSLPLSIGALEYEEEQVEALHVKAEEYLEQMVLGENSSFSKVTGDLVFPTELPGISTGVSWSTDAPWLVNKEGKVLNASLLEPEEVEIKAEVAYGSEKRRFLRLVRVCPPEYTEEERLLRGIQEELVSWEESSRTKKQLSLPKSVQGYRIEQAEENGFGAEAFLIVLAVVIPLLLYSGYFGSLDTKRKERKQQAEAGYTEFITKLSLLLAAGISLRRAIERLAEEYEKNYGQKHVLAMELKVTKQELDNGGSETRVYEEFGRRIGVLSYRRMASLLTQSVSRGVQGMRNLLLQEAKEMMAQEKANIRIKGEQAGTKLLLPMMGMLFLVFAVLLVPAFQSF